MTTHIMLDLETMGTGNNPAILALGAVAFTLKHGEFALFYEKISLERSQQLGFEIDASTVMWWLRQSEEARNEFLDIGNSPSGVLCRFRTWLKSFNVLGTPEPLIWSNGAAEDCIWLKNAYKKCELEVPWNFRQQRCYRTVREMHPEVECESATTAHNALEDARYQMRHLRKILC